MVGYKGIVWKIKLKIGIQCNVLNQGLKLYSEGENSGTLCWIYFCFHKMINSIRTQSTAEKPMGPSV